MNTVDPIRDIEQIRKMKDYLLTRNYRDYLLFILGINTGLRISDLLNLKVSDVKDKYHIIIKEQKTGKEKKFMLSDQMRLEIERYIEHKGAGEYLFNSKRKRSIPIDRIMAYRILNEAAVATGLETKIGTHTLRKTFGFHLYQQKKDVALLQYLFNHSSPSVTLRYIGINQNVADEVMKGFNL
jgi:integrase